MFVNSKEIKKVKAKGKLTQDWAGRTEIGSCNGHYPFHGSLDDFVIYTIALDSKTISKLSCTCSMKPGNVDYTKSMFNQCLLSDCSFMFVSISYLFRSRS
jgi:hypothetical protein